MVSYTYVKWLTVVFFSMGMVFGENARFQLDEKQSRATFEDLTNQRQFYATPQQANPEQAVGPHQFAPDARQWMNLPQAQQQQPLYIAQQQQYQIQYVQDNNVYPQQQQQQQYVPEYQSQNQLPYVYLPNAPAQHSSKPGITYVDPSAELLRNPKIQETLQNPKDRASTHNLVGLIQKYAHTNSLPVNYQPPAPQTYRQPQVVVSQPFYGQPQQQPSQTHSHPLYQRTNQVLSQQRYLVPVYEQTQQTIANAVYQRKEPLSLLDSYVPSALQVQYYKQLEQQQANAVPLPHFGKFHSDINGKTDYLKHFSTYEY